MRDPRARVLLMRCLDIARDLKLNAVAEGVENAQAEAMLIELGYPAAQGYFYARPAPLEEVVERLEGGGYVV